MCHSNVNLNSHVFLIIDSPKTLWAEEFQVRCVYHYDTMGNEYPK